MYLLRFTHLFYKWCILCGLDIYFTNDVGSACCAQQCLFYAWVMLRDNRCKMVIMGFKNTSHLVHLCGDIFYNIYPSRSPTDKNYRWTRKYSGHRSVLTIHFPVKALYKPFESKTCDIIYFHHVKRLMLIINRQLRTFRKYWGILVYRWQKILIP